MFEKEAKSAGVDLEFQLHESCKQLNVDHVSLDPTRVLQVLINLITNAIKFTRLETEKSRRILVSLSVSAERPTSNADGRVSFMRKAEGSEAATLQSDWKEGEPVSFSGSMKLSTVADDAGIRYPFSPRHRKRNE
jgi:signal transduction histidine kinase